MESNTGANGVTLNTNPAGEQGGGAPAEPTPNANPKSGETAPAGGEQQQPDLEAQIRAVVDEKSKAEKEVKRWKEAFDRTSSELAMIKGQLHAKGEQDTLEAIRREKEAEERANELKELRHYKALNEAVKRYKTYGLNDELAEQAAKAEMEQDYDAIADTMLAYNRQQIETAKTEWMKNRPPVITGSNGDGQEQDDFLAGMNKFPPVKLL